MKLVQGLGARSPVEAVELLAVDTNDVAQVAVSAENGTKDVVEFRELHAISDRHQPDDHGVHLAQDCS
jgi:hypothetical protein